MLFTFDNRLNMVMLAVIR